MRTDASPDDPRTRRSRDRLLGGLRAVARDGDVSISAVSAASGVTRATFYNHFESLEHAAWLAVVDSFEELMTRDGTARRDGSEPGVVGVETLRRIVDLLRVDAELVRLADSYRGASVVPGLVVIVVDLTHRFRAEFGASSTPASATEDVYVAAGLYAVLLTGAAGDRSAADVASEAYALLPTWMRRPPGSS